MWELTSNVVRTKWADVLDFVGKSGGVVMVRKWNKETAAVVPADWYRKAAAAIGEPEPPATPQPPAADQ